MKDNADNTYVFNKQNLDTHQITLLVTHMSYNGM